MAITDGPGAQLGPRNAGHRRRLATVLGVAGLGCAAVAVVLAVQSSHFPQSYVVRPPVSPPHVSAHEADSIVDTVGPRNHLPPLLPARSAVLRPGLRVDVGDVTEGSLRRTPHGGWDVVVRWDGRTQPLATRGTVSLDTGSSWVSAPGAIYTRVVTSTPGRFRVYGWRPEGDSAYVAPTLVATYLGEVCFNPSFTEFGDCARG